MNNKIFTAILATGLTLPVAAQAQSFAERDGQVDRRAAIGITIPFGSAQSEDTKPRVELRIRQDQAEPSWRGSDRNLRPYRSDQRIGFTLDKSPQLMLNGKAYSGPNHNARIGTVGYIAIGTVVVLGIGVLVLNDALNDASD